mmetsp:Transcript_24571/g.51459  ORF Transcript_24571/g.51459 Transcript_24571/m.51459 type:complete len:502 (+) Transcript_24571:141-1646(+)
MGMEIANLHQNQNQMADDFQPISYRSGHVDDSQQHPTSTINPSSNGDTQTNENSRHNQQNDFIAAELRRMQRVRDEENDALMQLLSRQQQMAAAANAAADSGSSSQFNGMANSSGGNSFVSSQMNNFMPQSLMNNRDINSVGMDGLNSMNNSMRLNSANSTLGSQLNNFMPSSLMNNRDLNTKGMDGLNSMNSSMRLNNANSTLGSQLNSFMPSSFMNGGSMNMNGIESMGLNHQMNMTGVPAATANSSSSQINKSDLPFDQQMNNFMPQSFNNHQNSANLDSLGMSDFMKNNNQRLPSVMNNSYMPPAAPNQPQPAPHEDPGWEEQYKTLREYHLKFGNCKVPARYKANAKLGRWVMTQRRQFTLLMQGFPSALTAERIRRLESLGFTWSVRPEPVSTWNKKFQELKAYKATYGNCMVPQRYQANSQLGTWVHTQRRQYKLMTEGKKSSMTKEKADALDSIGFFWAAKNSASTSAGRGIPSGENENLSDSSDHGESDKAT